MAFGGHNAGKLLFSNGYRFYRSAVDRWARQTQQCPFCETRNPKTDQGICKCGREWRRHRKYGIVYED